jgi:hypothetical protein
LTNFVQPGKPQSSTHYLPAEATFVTPLGISPASREIRTLRTELPEYELQAYLQKRNDWSDDVYDSISWRAYGSASAGLTDSLRTFVVKLSHSWLPIGVREKTMQYYD